MTYIKIKPNINLLPPYKNGTNLIIATEKVIEIENNQGIIIYGNVPKNVLYASINTNKESKMLKHGDVGVVICRCLEVHYEIKKLIEEEYPDLDTIWLCSSLNDTKIIVKSVMSEKSETPTLFFRLYTTKIQSIPTVLSKSKITSIYSENKLINSSIYIKSVMNTISKMYKITKNITVNLWDSCGNDSLNFVTDYIRLGDGEIVGISCIDHAKTKCAHTSTVTIIDNENDIIETFLTGSAWLSSEPNKNGVATHLLKCNHKKPFQIMESIYYNPETRIAPLESQVHKMLVFILTQI